MMPAISQEVIDRIESIRVKPSRIDDGSHWIVVSRRDGLNGTRWAVCDSSYSACLGRNGEWDYEPMPSSRTDAWLRNHRWLTFKEAWEAAEKCEVDK